jgi:hypothetical protein
VNPINRIQLETSQLFLSSAAHYSPEGALKAVLMKRFGSAAVNDLLSFDLLFWKRHRAREFGAEYGSVADLDQQLRSVLESLRHSVESVDPGLFRQLAGIAGASSSHP